jgi:acyl carrier protein
MEIKAALRQYILEHHFKGESGRSLQDDTPLLTSGIIDSIGVLGLIGFVEIKFGIEFMPRELDRDRLETIERIHEAIKTKLETIGAPYRMPHS